MNRKRHLIASITLLVTLLICIFPTGYAKAQSLSSSDVDAIAEELSRIEQEKGLYNLGNVDFSEIGVGEAIKSYEYIDGEAVESRAYYPLFSGNDLVAFAIHVDGNRFQIETYIASRVGSTKSNQISLIFDRNSCYVWNGYDLNTLYTFDDPSPERGIIPGSDISFCDSLDLTTLAPSTTINCCSAPSSRASAYFLKVNYVTQRPDSSICWAASIASITNYFKGTSYTARQIADLYSSGYRGTLAHQAAVNHLKNMTGKNYVYYSVSPSESQITTNLSRGYPVFGIWNISGSFVGHDCTIYGVDTVKNYISVMDPGFGPVRSYLSGWSYTYIDNGNRTLTLTGAGRVL